MGEGLKIHERREGPKGVTTEGTVSCITTYQDKAITTHTQKRNLTFGSGSV